MKTKIGPSAGFLANASASMEFCFKTPENSSVLHGSWLGVANRYVGLKFQISGQTHYGWARFSGVRQGPNVCSLTGVLTGYAYETVANQPILAGKTSGPQAMIGKIADTTQPASLAVLTLGAPALIVWRKEAATDTFRRINGFSLDITAEQGYEFIDGSIDRHEFRFARILDWIREHIEKLT